MASIKKRRDGKYRARYRDSSGKEHAKHFEQKKLAQKWIDSNTAALLSGNWVDPKAGKVTFEKWFERYLAMQVWTPGTIDAARRSVQDVPFASLPMNKIGPQHIQDWVKSLREVSGERKKPLAVSTLHTRFNYVHMVFTGAVRERIISTDPCERVKLPKKPRQGVTSSRIPSPEAVGEAVRQSPEWFRAYVAVCAFAGLRLGEAAGLQRGDIDFLGRTIQVRRQIQGTNVRDLSVVAPKCDSERTVHVPESLTFLLSRHIAEVGTEGPGEWIFSDVWGQRLNRSSAGHQWRRTRAKVGLDDYTLHDLRHFYASGLIAAGCDVVTVQRALGHSQPSITLNTYSHLWLDAADRTRAAAADLMTAALGVPADSSRTTDQKGASDLRV